MMDITTLLETGTDKCDLSDKSKTGEDKKIRDGKLDCSTVS